MSTCSNSCSNPTAFFLRLYIMLRCIYMMHVSQILTIEGKISFKKSLNIIIDQEKGSGNGHCGVLCCAEKKKIYNPFHSLAYIYQTKTHKRFKHTTRHRRRARADGVLNARLLYTKYSRSLKLNMCTQYHPPEAWPRTTYENTCLCLRRDKQQ